LECWNTEKAIFQHSIIPGEKFFLTEYSAQKVQKITCQVQKTKNPICKNFTMGVVFRKDHSEIRGLLFVRNPELDPEALFHGETCPKWGSLSPKSGNTCPTLNWSCITCYFIETTFILYTHV
jgi:hypothetical protein